MTELCYYDEENMLRLQKCLMKGKTKDVFQFLLERSYGLFEKEFGKIRAFNHVCCRKASRSNKKKKRLEKLWFCWSHWKS